MMFTEITKHLVGIEPNYLFKIYLMNQFRKNFLPPPRKVELFYKTASK